MRDIILDVETTGLSAAEGHRIVEIACVEMRNFVRTGEIFHQYINPERDVPAEVVRVHGLDETFLRDFPPFSEIAPKLLDFIGDDATLVIHNAPFDTGFLNHHLAECGLTTLAHLPIVDTLVLARQLFPGSPASLDALCRRFRLDLAARDKHGALIDTQLLADVYVELKGGRQAPMAFAHIDALNPNDTSSLSPLVRTRPFRTPRLFAPSAEELARHDKFLNEIPQTLWRATPS